jgi:hypothetical protein
MGVRELVLGDVHRCSAPKHTAANTAASLWAAGLVLLGTMLVLREGI